MQFTDEAKALLKKLEGCRLVSYLDDAGCWTVGFGHCGPDVTPGTVWSREQAELTLDRDVARFATAVRHELASAPPLSDPQFSTLVIFVFNVGVHAFHGSTLLRVVEAGDFDSVPSQLLRWTKIHTPSGHVVDSPVLVKRRQAEIALWLSGKAEKPVA